MRLYIFYILLTFYCPIFGQAGFFTSFTNGTLEKESVKFIVKSPEDSLIMVSTGVTKTGFYAPWKQIFRYIDQNGGLKYRSNWAFSEEYTVNPYGMEYLSSTGHYFAICGSADDNITPYDRKAYVTLHNGAGELLSSTLFSDSAFQISAEDICEIKGTSNLAVCGFKLKPTDGSILFGFVYGIDHNGHKIWEIDLHGSFSQIKPLGIQSDDNGNLYVMSEDRALWPSLNQTAITKLSSSGDSLWTKYYLFEERCTPKHIERTFSNDFVISTSIYNSSLEETIPSFFAIDTSGHVLWREGYTDELSASSFAERFTLTKDGGYVMAVNDNDGVNEFITVIKTNSIGKVLNYNSFELGVNYPRDIVETNDGSLYITGAVNQNTNANNETIWLLKIDSLLNLTSFTLEPSLDKIFFLYPNPTSDELILSTDKNFKNIQLFLTNQMGRIILKKSVHGKQSNISLSGLTAGIYYINVLDEGRLIYTEKIIKKNR